LDFRDVERGRFTVDGTYSIGYYSVVTETGSIQGELRSLPGGNENIN